jgi:hypothetical protein
VVYKNGANNITTGQNLPLGVYDNVIPTATCDAPHGTLTATKCPSMTVQGVISCALPTGTYSVGDAVPAPTLVCAAEAGGNIQNHSRTYGGDVPQEQNQWGNNGTGVYTTSGTKNVTIQSAICGNTTHTSLGVTCTGTLNIKSVDELGGISCTFAKSEYGMGEEFKPTLTCPSGYTLDGNGITYTGGPDGQQNQWGNNGNGAYATSGNKSPVATFNCQKGNVKTPVSANCGTITITKPTCALPASNEYSTNQNVPAPTVICYGTTSAAGYSREYTSTAAVGTGLPNNHQWDNASNGQYTTSGAKGPITLKKAICNNNTVDNLGVSCTGPGGATTFVIK